MKPLKMGIVLLIITTIIIVIGYLGLNIGNMVAHYYSVGWGFIAMMLFYSFCIGIIIGIE